jgi:hypothetical protein
LYIFNTDHDSTKDCLNQFKSDTNLIKCGTYEYDTSNVHSKMNSAAMEFNLVCGDSYLKPLISSLIFVSKFFGAAISGYVSDEYG